MPRFSSQKNFEQIKNHRLLHERSNLTIEFPQTNRRIFRAQIPFLQNPIITERGQSNLVEYDLVGRAGNLYSYGGSKSRSINLSFTINLLHLLYTDSTEGIRQKFLRQFNLFYADKERAKKAFDLRPGGVYDQTKKAEERASAQLSRTEERAARNSEIIRKYKEEQELTEEFGPLIGGTPAGMTDPVELEQFYENRAKKRQELYDAAIDDLYEAERQAYEDAEVADQAKINLQNIQNDINYDADFAEQNKKNLADLKWSKGFPHAETHINFYQSLVRLAAGGKLNVKTSQAYNGQVPGVTQFSQNKQRSVNTGKKDEEGNDIFESVDVAGQFEQVVTAADTTKFTNLINLVYVWLNLIRATTMNNSKATTQGPPIVRLTHGPMYNNVPFVVNDYNFEVNQQAGYDIQTLTPKEIKISMTLKEFRTPGGTFTASQIEDGDRLAGWEAIIENNNIDPYNGDISDKVIETYGNNGNDIDDGLQDGPRGTDDTEQDQAAGIQTANREWERTSEGPGGRIITLD